jgi:hypothetical protein
LDGGRELRPPVRADESIARQSIAEVVDHVSAARVLGRELLQNWLRVSSPCAQCRE